MKKRLSWIDVCKGISIFFIVLGHVYVKAELRWIIYSFHVPIFFFLSGVTSNNETISIKSVSKNFKSIMLPYYIVAIVSILVFSFLGAKVFLILGRNPSDSLNYDQNASLGNLLWGMLYGNSKAGNMKWNLPLWFLPCFFVVKILGLCLEKIIKNKSYRVVVIASCMIFSWIYCRFFSFLILPFQFETSINMLAWYEIGRLLSDKIKILDQTIMKKKSTIMILGMIFGAFGIIMAVNNAIVQCRLDQYGNVVLYYGACSCLIFFFLSISFIINQNKYMELVGQNSLIILLLHKFPIVVFQMIFKSVLNSGNLIVDGLFGILFAFISIYIIMFLNSKFSNLVPRMIAVGK